MRNWSKAHTATKVPEGIEKFGLRARHVSFAGWRKGAGSGNSAMLPASRRRRRTAVVVMLLALAAPVPSLAAGPWQALVVDAGTQAPLEGVAVLARWHRRAQGHPAIGLERTGFYSAVETTSRGDGRFRIPVRTQRQSLNETPV